MEQQIIREAARTVALDILLSPGYGDGQVAQALRDYGAEASTDEILEVDLLVTEALSHMMDRVDDFI